MTKKQLLPVAVHSGSKSKASRITARRTLPLAALCLSLAAQVQAQDSGGWSWSVAPYLWGSSLKGATSTLPGAPPADVELSFSTLLDNLDFAGMVVANGRSGRWGITGDLQYVKLNTQSGALGPGGGNVQAKIQNTIATLLADYLVSEGTDYQFWASGGLRYWRVKQDVTVTPGGPIPGGTNSWSNDWIDPVVGVRGRKNVGENGYLTGWAYLGGFGAGSEMMADVFAGYGYQFTPVTAGVLGYRWMSVDRKDGTYVYDMVQQGPLLGVAFRF
ncbi:hypothetical protein [Primorskyibacter sp. S87]|uniref:hypothetical protein n=1 Tax=Primorskyibacter sp. S87 TaxID=3415126 RepID=UPI003C7BD609